LWIKFCRIIKVAQLYKFLDLNAKSVKLEELRIMNFSTLFTNQILD